MHKVRWVLAEARQRSREAHKPSLVTKSRLDLELIHLPRGIRTRPGSSH